MHFFSKRTDGTHQLNTVTKWRLGSGNVHFTHDETGTPKPDELNNASENVKAILKKYIEFDSAPKKQVLLSSVYGKGISIVDHDFLNNDGLTRDPEGRIIIQGDGLFCTQKDILLLNKSGDAHAVIFESPTAVGIVVGSWRCVEKGILPNMMEHFLRHGVDPKDIQIHVGPGLGKSSYDLGEAQFSAIKAEHDNYAHAFTKKPEKPNKPTKYTLDFGKLISLFAEFHNIHSVHVGKSINTFDRDRYHRIKSRAKRNKNPQMLLDYYAKQLCFGARQYSKVDKQVRKIANLNKVTLPDGLEGDKATYNGTGRCLNGVVLRPK